MDPKKKFGLIIPKKSENLKVKARSIFDSDSEGEDTLKRKRPVIPQKKISIKNMIKEETIDPSIYEYDNIYDDMKAKQAECLAPKAKQSSRYIDTLLKAADKRKKEYERRVEKKIQVERVKEGDKFKDKEEFVTAAYKQKMLEREEEEERERREAMLNDMMDVTKQKDLSGFYRHFLKQTVGEEKVPKFGEKYIKQEYVSEEEINNENLSQETKEKYCKNMQKDNELKLRNKSQLTKCTSDINVTNLKNCDDQIQLETLDRDSDNIEIDSDDNYDKQISKKLESNKKQSFGKDSDVNFSETVDNGKGETLKNAKKRNRKYSDSSSSDSVHRNKTSFKPIRHKSKKHTRKSKKSNSDNEPENFFELSEESKLKGKSTLEIKARHDSDTSDGETKENNASDKRVDDSVNLKKERKNIYAKRTIGDVFAQAQARYFQRMADKSI